MKIIFTLLCSVAFSYATMAQTSASANKELKTTSAITSGTEATTAETVKTESETPASPAESVSFPESEFDFGKIPQGKPVTHVFEFKNVGASPITLDNVQASCGCTTPEWNKDVVPPGATSKITVGYNAQTEGTFAKPVTITYNGNQTKQIIIKGEVWRTPVNSAPENTKINSLKNE